MLSLPTQANTMEAVGPGQIVFADHLGGRVPQLRRPQFRIFILYFLYVVCQFGKENVALLFYIILRSGEKCRKKYTEK